MTQDRSSADHAERAFADAAAGDRPPEPRELRPLGPLGLLGSTVTGLAMGVAEVVPGFSGGTVAFVAGVYERLIGALRDGAHVLGLLVRGRWREALTALRAIEWPFAIALFGGMFVAMLTLASTLERLIEERPTELQAIFLGLVVGAAIVSTRQLRTSAWWHPLLVVVSTACFFVLLGASPGMVQDPSLLALFLGAAVAVCAWILPGISGSFILLLLGMWASVISALAQRDLLVLLVVAAGCVTGLALFSTLLHWALARAHDAILAVLIGLMLGSARVLWPWPTEAPLGSAELAAPEGATAFLVAALALTAMAAVWMLGLTVGALERWRARRGVHGRSPVD